VSRSRPPGERIELELTAPEARCLFQLLEMARWTITSERPDSGLRLSYQRLRGIMRALLQPHTAQAGNMLDDGGTLAARSGGIPGAGGADHGASRVEGLDEAAFAGLNEKVGDQAPARRPTKIRH
jgi:hypothetical protein